MRSTKRTNNVSHILCNVLCQRDATTITCMFVWHPLSNESWIFFKTVLWPKFEEVDYMSITRKSITRKWCIKQNDIYLDEVLLKYNSLSSHFQHYINVNLTPHSPHLFNGRELLIWRLTLETLNERWITIPNVIVGTCAWWVMVFIKSLKATTPLLIRLLLQ
jgi:hypothetical protein